MDAKYLASLAKSQTPTTDMIAAITPHYLDFHKRYRDETTMPVHDSSAIAYLIKPDLFSTKKLYVDVIKGEHPCSGQTVADWKNHWGREAKTNVCLGVNADEMLAMYIKRVGGSKK